MDRAISVEERIKRAEEIYNKRNGRYINTNETKKYKKKRGKVKKLIMQMFVCLMIYLAFYIFTNSDYIFSEEFLNQIKGNFNQDSKIYSMYLNVKSFFQNKISTDNTQNVENVVLEEGIGGAKEQESEDNKKDEEKEDSNKTKENNEKTEMEQDAENIKQKMKFIVPVQGNISSTFGWRNPTTNTVPKYHTGLDIAAIEGTIIKSATDGKVILSSSKGDYGKHYKIQNGNVILIYAHCSKLYLKEGDKVKKGDKIAEVGSTGNSTGPHLHFEIRIEDRLVDPQLILDI